MKPMPERTPMPLPTCDRGQRACSASGRPGASSCRITTSRSRARRLRAACNCDRGQRSCERRVTLMSFWLLAAAWLSSAWNCIPRSALRTPSTCSSPVPPSAAGIGKPFAAAIRSKVCDALTARQVAAPLNVLAARSAVGAAAWRPCRATADWWRLTLTRPLTKPLTLEASVELPGVRLGEPP